MSKAGVHARNMLRNPIRSRVYIQLITFETGHRWQNVASSNNRTYLRILSQAANEARFNPKDGYQAE
jgi:hypothetical protein